MILAARPRVPRLLCGSKAQWREPVLRDLLGRDRRRIWPSSGGAFCDDSDAR